MKLHRWAQLINMFVIVKNENSCSLSFSVICPWSTKSMADKVLLKNQKNKSFHILDYDTHFDKLSSPVQCAMSLSYLTGRVSATGSVSAWHASGSEFDPHVRHILSWRLGHENISTAILPLIQEEQLSVRCQTCEKLLPGRSMPK